MKKIVALLPMKAHSERIPGKNFRDLSGKPLFRWILDSLLDLSQIGLIVINTDARDILKSHEVSDGGKILIRDRKVDLQGDYTSMNDIIRDDIESVSADTYLMTHTTNPFLSKGTVGAAVKAYTCAEDKDSLFTVSRLQARLYSQDGMAINHNPDALVRTQDLEPWFVENSCMYLFGKSSFMKTSARIGAKPIMYEIPTVEALDIDTPEDWFMAEAIAEYKSLRL